MANGSRVSEPVFSEPLRSRDPIGFATPHASDDQVYNEVEALLQSQTTTFDKSRIADDQMITLAQLYGSRGADVCKAIESNKRIVFHAMGDTGSSDSRKYQTELTVSDQLTLDAITSNSANRPAFAFHLGDVVYSFGEARFYYDQFYEPFRDYPAPILAIPGNHDSFIVPGTAPTEEPLRTFARNFCSSDPIITPEAASLHRTAMTQPGVYFALDAPFVRILALFSNALEDPGIISSENGRWPNVPDHQLSFLRAQLRKIKQDGYRGAILLVTHHPAFAYNQQDAPQAAGGHHAGSPGMLADVDRICGEEGVYPHAWLSGHAHNYQRYTRTVTSSGAQRQVPFIVCGNGGHDVNPLVKGSQDKPAVEPSNGADVSYLDAASGDLPRGLVLEKFDDHEYGYLRISADSQAIAIAYHQVDRSLAQSRYDLVTVSLQNGLIGTNA